MIPFRTPAGFDAIQAETLCRRLSPPAQEGFAAAIQSVPFQDCPQCAAETALSSWEWDGPYAMGQKHAYRFILSAPHECTASYEASLQEIFAHE